MSTDETRILHGEVTERILGAAFEVHNILGYGFLEKVYQRALQAELIRRGCTVAMEHPLKVFFKGVVVGEYFADLLVDESVIVEVKVARSYNSADEAQLLNELKATGTRVGLLVNFGRERVEYKRMIV